MSSQRPSASEGVNYLVQISVELHISHLLIFLDYETDQTDFNVKNSALEREYFRTFFTTVRP